MIHPYLMAARRHEERFPGAWCVHRLTIHFDPNLVDARPGDLQAHLPQRGSQLRQTFRGLCSRRKCVNTLL
jgi:hypothetical protein